MTDRLRFSIICAFMIGQPVVWLFAIYGLPLSMWGAFSTLAAIGMLAAAVYRLIKTWAIARPFWPKICRSARRGSFLGRPPTRVTPDPNQLLATEKIIGGFLPVRLVRMSGGGLPTSRLLLCRASGHIRVTQPMTKRRIVDVQATLKS